MHLNSVLKKNPNRCNSMQIFIYCKVTLHVSGVTAPIIRSTKSVTAASSTGHNTGTATSLQRGLIGIRPCWREVAVPVLWPVPEAAVTDLVLLMMVAVTPETCRVTLQWIYICILLHLVGFLLTLIFNNFFITFSHAVPCIFFSPNGLHPRDSFGIVL